MKELRVQVAELCGWRFDDYNYFDASGQAYDLCDSVLPDYPNDLNACAEFEKGLTLQQTYDYFVRLRAIVENNSALVKHQVWHATAEQRCRAFVATMEGTK